MTIATTYTELMAAIRAQVEALQVKLTDFDELAGFPAGLSGKVFGPLQVKRLGPEKMFDALRAAGLAIRVEVDPEQVARMQARIAANFLPRCANQARNGNHASPLGMQLKTRVLRQLASNGGKARMQGMTKAERSAHGRRAANARWIRFRKRKAAVAHQRRVKDRKRAEQATAAQEAAE
jgi:hypothetical protein